MHANAAKLILDVETGGFSVEKHALLEVGWTITDSEWNTLEADSIYILPQPGRVVEPQAAAVNGYSPELWEQYGAVELPVAQARFFEKMAPYGWTAVHGHNVVSFDKRWMETFFGHWTAGIRDWVCSMQALREYCKASAIPVVKGSTDTVTGRKTPGTLSLHGGAKLAGITIVEAHGAVGDCLATARLFKFLEAVGKNKLVA